ncbi:PQQ-dependent sugar dehydrogenase [Archangium violaceum]|uniref:PQQ-dependent sugar dehydrogenase n=1 Tax=Archangium violaceum TaxID=83451 RepID=UPI00193C24F9|nr:PQQ-dependent sugar dehydrogenase [Archangium violaceum]QRK07494.1 PQQ-dependent sugar dehydrogenase [Archangium violaceum]
MPSLRSSLLSLAFLAACSDGTGPDNLDLDSDSPESLSEAIAAGFSITEVADFNSPWAMTFLPDGRMLVTEKAGTLHLVSADGTQRKTVTGTLPVSSAGQGGLLDVVLHPQFAQNRLVYFSYSESRSSGKGVALARGTFTDGTSPSLTNVRVIFRATPYVSGDGHFSGRIAFSPDGKLFFTNGDRQKFDPAQDPTGTLGKVLRLNDDGTPAAGNPLAARGFHPAVWSYGHRNLLGLAFDASGNLWEHEMGPQGGDEVNLIRPSLNYGWPNASNGSHYDGRDIPDHRTGDGYEPPKVWWNPSISPGGLMVYSGKLWPEWKGDLFIGGLSSQSLVRVDVNGTSASKGDQWNMNSRIREVEEGPDGSIWLLQDGQSGSQGKLLRLRPAS